MYFKMNLLLEYRIVYIVSYCCILCVQVNLTLHCELISIDEMYMYFQFSVPLSTHLNTNVVRNIEN